MERMTRIEKNYKHKFCCCANKDSFPLSLLITSDLQIF